METFLELLKAKQENLHKSQNLSLGFLEAIGFEREQYEAYSMLEENFIDRIVLEFKKVARIKKAEGKNVYVAQIFLDAIFTDEGQKFFQLIDEHISTNTMKYFVLMQTFKEFERKMILPGMVIPPPEQMEQI